MEESNGNETHTGRSTSIKGQTCDERSHRVRLKVNLNVRIPGTWSEFLRDNTNTMELFKYLTEDVMQRLYSGIYNYRYVQWNGVIPYRREPYRRVPLGRVHLDERRLDEVQ